MSLNIYINTYQVKTSIPETLKSIFTGTGAAPEWNQDGVHTATQNQAVQTDVSNSRAVKDTTVNKRVKDVLYFTPSFSLTKSIAIECGLHKFYQVVSLSFSWKENIIHSLYHFYFIPIINFLIYICYSVHQYYQQATKNWRASKRRIHFAEGLDFIQQLDNKFIFPRKSGDWK